MLQAINNHLADLIKVILRDTLIMLAPVKLPCIFPGAPLKMNTWTALRFTVLQPLKKQHSRELESSVGVRVGVGGVVLDYLDVDISYFNGGFCCNNNNFIDTCGIKKWFSERATGTNSYQDG